MVKASRIAEHPAIFAAASDEDLPELKKMVIALVTEADADFNAAKNKLEKNPLPSPADEVATTAVAAAVAKRGVPNPIDAVKNKEEIENDAADGGVGDADEEFEEDEEEMEEDEEEADEEESDDGGEEKEGVKGGPSSSSSLWQTNDAILVEAAQSAIHADNIAALRIIVECGAVITSPSLLTGGTVLHVAAEHGHTEILEYLLSDKKDGGAGLAAFINDAERTDASSTPLHWAAIRGMTACCERLIAAGVHKDVRNKDRYTALHLAQAQGKDECFGRLLALGCDPNVPNEDGHTCLHLALGDIENEDIATLLITSGKADLGARDIVDWTPMALAVTEGNAAMAKLLLEAGAPIVYGGGIGGEGEGGSYDEDEDEDLDEESADLPLISIAAKAGNSEIVSLLVSHRAADVAVDLAKKDRMGKTPLEWAAAGPAKSRAAIISLLKNCTATTEGARKREREE